MRFFFFGGGGSAQPPFIEGVGTKYLPKRVKKTTVNADKNEPKIILKTACFSQLVSIIKQKQYIDKNKIIESIQRSNQEIFNGIALWLAEGSGWTAQSIDEQHISIAKYKPLKGSSYTKLPQ